MAGYLKKVFFVVLLYISVFEMPVCLAKPQHSSTQGRRKHHTRKSQPSWFKAFVDNSVRIGGDSLERNTDTQLQHLEEAVLALAKAVERQRQEKEDEERALAQQLSNSHIQLVKSSHFKRVSVPCGRQQDSSLQDLMEPIINRNHLASHIRDTADDASRRRRRSTQKDETEPWQCATNAFWSDLGPHFYPRFVRAVSCTRKPCWYSFFSCQERAVVMTVLRRHPTKPCKPVYRPGSVIRIGDVTYVREGVRPVRYEQEWILQPIRVPVMCQCARTDFFNQ